MLLPLLPPLPPVESFPPPPLFLRPWISIIRELAVYLRASSSS